MRFGNVNEGETEGFQEKAKRLVVETSPDEVTEDEVYVVWFSKTLQNWKALLSTMLPNDLYFEVTYNGDKKESYVDIYKKIQNIPIADND